MQNPEQQVILVDAEDNDLGVAEKLSAHREGLLHRAFSVFIFRQQNNINKKSCEILLQQREKNKYHSGGLWTNTCCSHPRPGEATRDAAMRRLYEEMGIEANLTEIGIFSYRAKVGNDLIEHEVDHVFAARWDGECRYDAQEVAAINWISLEELQQALITTPQDYTAWFKQALDIFAAYYHA